MLNLGQLLESWLRSFNAPDVTNLFILIIFIVFGLAVVLSLARRAHNFVHFAPNLMTTLGMLGTFIGIVIGLLDFKVGNSAEIQQSIGPLLEGLKTAFITSLAGMCSAIVFKSIGSVGWLRLGSKEDVPSGAGPDEIYHEIRLQREAMERLIQLIAGEEDATLISQVRLLRSDQRDALQTQKSSLDKQVELLDVVAQEAVTQKIYHEIRLQREAMERLIQLIAGEEDATLISQVRLLRSDQRDALQTQKSSLDKQVELLDVVAQEAVTQTKRFDTFRNELWQKLDEFAEMLSKSATEQVINVLREVINDFNQNLTEQFGENFKELNAAVAKLVEWQENYRTQLEQMGQQYAVGVQAIVQTEASVAHISEKSKQIPVAMSELKSVLDTTQHQLGELKRHLEAFRDMRDRAVEAVPQIREQMDIMVNDVSSAVKNAGENIVTAGEVASLALVEGAQQFEDNVNRTNQGLVSASDQLVKNSETIRDQLDDTVKDINAHVREMVDVVKNSTSSLGETLIGANQDLQNNIKEVQFQVTDSIESMQKRLEGSLENVFHTQTEAMHNAFNAVDGELRRVVGTTGDAVNKQLEAMDKAMQQELERVITQLGQHLASITRKFTDDYSVLTEQMERVIRQNSRFDQHPGNNS